MCNWWWKSFSVFHKQFQYCLSLFLWFVWLLIRHVPVCRQLFKGKSVDVKFKLSLCLWENFVLSYEEWVDFFYFIYKCKPYCYVRLSQSRNGSHQKQCAVSLIHIIIITGHHQSMKTQSYSLLIYMADDAVFFRSILNKLRISLIVSMGFAWSVSRLAIITD